MAFNTKNLNYAFNVEYYSINDVNDANNSLLMIRTDAKDCYCNEDDSFELQTCYPGLLVGIGNVHGSDRKEEIELGFSFDYVTGSPYIPGSSVKGLLRSAFAHEDDIHFALGDENIDVEKLKNEIFEGRNGDADIPVPQRDVFYDSFPVTQGRLMAKEAITPHGDELTSPIPIALVKVRPNVIFKFSFGLHDGIITAEKKRALFKTIIKDFGVGAKTNVGFGVFAEVDKNKPFVESKPASRPQPENKSFRNGQQRAQARSSSSNTVIKCVDCGKEYTLSDYEEKQKNEQNYTYTRCRSCRDKRKRNI